MLELGPLHIGLDGEFPLHHSIEPITHGPPSSSPLPLGSQPQETKNKRQEEGREGLKLNYELKYLGNLSFRQITGFTLEHLE